MLFLGRAALRRFMRVFLMSAMLRPSTSSEFFRIVSQYRVALRVSSLALFWAADRISAACCWARVLDLFAGSGQLGIEALSRGAKSCLFVDRSAEALAVVKANCKTAGVDRQSDIRQGEAESFLANIRGPFDLALLDPPFHHDTVAAVLPLLAAKMAPGGVVLCETEREADLPEQAGALTLVKQYNYGKIKVSRYERGEEV